MPLGHVLAPATGLAGASIFIASQGHHFFLKMGIKKQPTWLMGARY